MRRPVATRRTQTALAGLAAGLVLLAGCSSSSSKPAASTSSSTGSTASSGASSGAPGADAIGVRPAIQVPAGQPDGKLGVKVKIPGDGAKVIDGSAVVLQYTAKLWRDGSDLGSSYDQGQHPVTSVEGQGQMLPGWEQGLKGQAAGSRVEVTVPPALGFGAKGSTSGKITITGTDTLIFDLDIIGVYPSAQADIPAGTGVLNDPALPTVATAVGKDDPKVTIPAGKQPPAGGVYKPVIVGKGPQVKKGQTIVVQYEGLVWRTGQIFDSSFSKGKSIFATPIGVGAVVQGWDDGLIGQTVGSRVLLVIPPDKGYGAQGQPSAGIQGTDTMVFVVDILDAR
ncbi:FKBP-type peptidyl-prolyl cis-trans isomerase [Catenulispora rubra]|uniref:FKBP-type peptidyl-prolyl cis-trans isomerase n=1 Tax=Catenulispora rubra TaxID=280293 RepID=UPI00189252F1|nr:FKBP-type peptidyl-prolyl cis-trans isomerase [Catenulispora rubra]